MEIFIPGWNFNSIFRIEKNSNYVKNLNPGWNIIASVNRKFNESKKAKPEAWQKQIETKMAAVNKKLKFVILQQVNIILLLLLRILAAIENFFNIHEWEFYIWTGNLLQTFYKVDKFIISPFETCPYLFWKK